MRRWLPLLALACAPEDDACERVCAPAAAAFADCLADGGGTWESAGYAGEADFLDACETWAWEMRRIAGAEPDRRDALDALDAECAHREQALAEDGACEAFTAFEWHELP